MRSTGPRTTTQTVDVGGGADPTASFLIRRPTPRGRRERQLQRVGSMPAPAGRSAATSGISATATQKIVVEPHDDARLPDGRDVQRHPGGHRRCGTVAGVTTGDGHGGDRRADGGLHVLAAADPPAARTRCSSIRHRRRPFQDARSRPTRGTSAMAPSSDAGAIRSHTYAGAASFNVTLTVTDSAGKVGRVTKTVRCSNLHRGGQSSHRGIETPGPIGPGVHRLRGAGGGISARRAIRGSHRNLQDRARSASLLSFRPRHARPGTDRSRPPAGCAGRARARAQARA